VSRLPLRYPLAALAAFVALSVLVAVGWPPLVQFDTSWSDRARAFGVTHPAWVSTLRVITDAGATGWFLAVGIALAALLAIRRGYRPAAVTAAVTIAVPVIWALMHLWLHRPRPVAGFVILASNGFPSGHTSHATAASLLVVLLLWPRLRRPGRTVAVTVAVLVALVVGVSRAALLAHWPVDVLGGWLLGLAVVGIAAWVPSSHARDRDHPVRRPGGAGAAGPAGAEGGPGHGAGPGAGGGREPGRLEDP